MGVLLVSSWSAARRILDGRGKTELDVDAGGAAGLGRGDGCVGTVADWC
jgi:uncharacterized protein (UPF0254 family)